MNMTENQIFIKALRKAEANGYDSPSNDSYDWLTYEAIIFCHCFAKAFWGERKTETRIDFVYYWVDSKEEAYKQSIEDFLKLHSQKDLDLLIDRTSHIIGNRLYLGEVTDYLIQEGWEYHLQQMVLYSEPLRYIEKFLGE